MVPPRENEEGISVHIPDSLSRTLVIALVTGLLGAVGISTVNLVEPVRYDAWTKTMDDQRHAEVERRLQACEAHITNAEPWKRRITVLETLMGIENERRTSN